MTFFSLRSSVNHHDFALMEVGFDASSPDDDTTGLAHVAFNVGGSAEEFGLVRSLLNASRTPVLSSQRRERHDERCSTLDAPHICTMLAFGESPRTREQCELPLECRSPDARD
jgi:hypothetical protein